MKRHKQPGGQVISLENLSAAACEAMRGKRGKRGKRTGAEFFGRWETEVIALERELREGTYRPGAYHYFTIHEPKQRVVAAAPFRDRVVHHALVRVLGRFLSLASSRTAMRAVPGAEPMPGCGGRCISQSGIATR